MRINKDYHIHSKYSKNGHCKSEIETIVQKAIGEGLDEIAISDHGIKHVLYGTSEKNLIKAKNEIRILNDKYKNINIKLGIEANLLSFDGLTDISDLVAENCEVIQMGIHYGVVFRGIRGFVEFFLLNFLSKFIPQVRQYMIRRNTDAMIKAMDKYNIDIITHPGDKIPVDIDRLSRKAEETNTMLEINNSHKHLTTEEITIASQYGVKFIIGSDSHDYENIGKFEDSLDRVIKAGLRADRVENLEV
ncbi:MAG: PHP domain-containing protein [Eubacteriales bacterium]|nr:PHP domain-containing protein [Eubacteriales bacterium]